MNEKEMHEIKKKAKSISKQLKEEIEAIKLKIYDLPEYKDWPGQVNKDRILEVFNKKLKLPLFTERIKKLEDEVCPLREELVNKTEEISQLKSEMKRKIFHCPECENLRKEISRLHTVVDSTRAEKKAILEKIERFEEWLEENEFEKDNWTEVKPTPMIEKLMKVSNILKKLRELKKERDKG